MASAFGSAAARPGRDRAARQDRRRAASDGEVATVARADRVRRSPPCSRRWLGLFFFHLFENELLRPDRGRAGGPVCGPRRGARARGSCIRPATSGSRPIRFGTGYRVVHPSRAQSISPAAFSVRARTGERRRAPSSAAAWLDSRRDPADRWQGHLHSRRQGRRHRRRARGPVYRSPMSRKWRALRGQAAGVMHGCACAISRRRRSIR